MILSEAFDEALAFAHGLHRRQGRKGSDTPYIAHLLAVCSIVLENGGSEAAAIAALLHDAVEDQGGLETLAAIRDRFGEEVAEIVAGCSDCLGHPKPPWRERKEAYLAHLATASPEVRLVSCADKVHNARSVVRDYKALGEALWPRFKGGGRDGSLWYYRAGTDEFLRGGPLPLANELDALVTEMERLAADG